MIIVSEIGDKTFLIAAILSMRHPRLVVFAGAFSSLLVMSILSAAMGHVLPTLIARRWTQLAAAVLFLVFGLKMLKEGREMQGGSEKIQEELREVEEEIALKDVDGGSANLNALEGGHVHTDSTSTPKFKEQGANDLGEGAKNFASLFFGPVFIQAFILTFLGEWGDRSQIATIALAAAHVRLLTTPEDTCSSVAPSIAECLYYHYRNCGRAQLLYSSRGPWGSLALHEDLHKAWCVAFRSALKPLSLTIHSNAWRSGSLHPLRSYLLPRSINLCRP